MSYRMFVLAASVGFTMLKDFPEEVRFLSKKFTKATSHEIITPISERTSAGRVISGV